MKGWEDEQGSVLEKQTIDADHARVWQVAFSSLEQALGKDATEALCFHISKRSGAAVDRLLVEDPERFRQTVISIVQGDVDIVLSRLTSGLRAEFELDSRGRSFVEVMHELGKRT